MVRINLVQEAKIPGFIKEKIPSFGFGHSQ